MNQKRLDQIFQQYFPQYSRSKSQSLIERGKVQVLNHKGEYQTLVKPGLKFDPDTFSVNSFRILEDDETRYVSRGALKLKQAVTTFNIDVKNKVCMDVGLSTGGFSDYLLQMGAGKVLGIDVGKDQLHSRLKDNPKLLYFDKVNARQPLPAEILTAFFGNSNGRFDLIVVDVSFISLEKVIPNLSNYLAANGVMVCLIKPQFELEKSQLNKKGVVKDPVQVDAVVQKISGVFNKNQLEIIGICPSPIEGENGNKEVLISSRRLKLSGT